MSEPKKTETWVIQHKETGEYFKTRNGKNAWASKGAAKNAWAYRWMSNTLLYDESDVKSLCEKAKVDPVPTNRQGRTKITFPYFDQQDSWELVNLIDKSVEDTGTQLKRAKELLWEAYSHLEPSFISEEIKQFLDETKGK